MDPRDVVFRELHVQCQHDNTTYVITVDQGAQLLNNIARDFPRQYLNIGVREPLAVSVAAGMALMGHRVYIFGITAFLLRRAYEQIYLDVGLHQLPVTLLAVGAGRTYALDGPTHWCEEDALLMQQIPNMHIELPDTPEKLQQAVQSYRGPRYIRVPKQWEASTNVTTR